ncbi:MAG: endonuclease [Gammaproteobacteria bacterium]|nr:endonuclease [Gammaproteobacteria bacterium]
MTVSGSRGRRAEPYAASQSSRRAAWWMVLLCLCLNVAAGSVARAERGAAKDAAYLQILPVFWRNLYPHGGRTLYCGQRFEPFDDQVNVEHVFPMAWVGNALRCGDRDACRLSSERFNRIESDMHNLWPALKRINRARGALRFGEIEGEERRFGGCDFERDNRRRLVEPGPRARGAIARSMLYMHDRYGLELFARHGALLKRWHFQYPPDDEERRRNAIVEKLQGNRNPFIDSPQRAAALKF